MFLSYLHWRYWIVGSRRFKEIASIDIQYSPTGYLDVYHPIKKKQASPIILFVYGGSWSSGSKLLYTTFANTLRELGYVVIVPDYRKYPEVKIDAMYKDIREAIKWTYKHANEIHGDPDMIYMLGHSAGAQLISQVVLSDVIEKAKYSQMSFMNKKHDPTIIHEPFDFLPQIEGLLLFSGVYDIQRHFSFETSRGIEKVSAMSRAMGSTVEGYKANSPLCLIERNASLFTNEIVDLWPRILLLHGQKDTIVGMDQSANMFNALGKVFPAEHRDDVDVRMRLYKRMNHSEPVTALMPDLFSRKSLQKSLIRDIKEFIDIPEED
ncbi:hypothetical protein G6F37_009244 [Rhizopus arrhizus]|nr:hypothetical protein G6F38_008594 [Rhizopus arrhizus]KAG1154661.1 hypothetical protein G6F37_009244 [Rhizopus arrhizus]